MLHGDYTLLEKKSVKIENSTNVWWWKSNNADISMLYDFYSTPPTKSHWIFNFRWFFLSVYITSSRYIWWPHWVRWWCYRWAACPAIAITLFLGRSGRQTPFREIVSPTDTISSKRFFTGIFVDPLFGVGGGGKRGCEMKWQSFKRGWILKLLNTNNVRLYVRAFDIPHIPSQHLPTLKYQICTFLCS